jgi:dethiobiotin synthetase
VSGLFVTGTDTGAGKTVVAAAIAAALAAHGRRVAARKPVLTGLDEPPDGPWPADDVVLARATGEDPAVVAPVRFGPPVSPHLAAERAGVALSARELAAGARAGTDDADVLVVEGVGGLLVPLGPTETVRDLAAALGLPLVVAARPGLGTLSHTLLTLEPARAAGLTVAAIVLTPWPEAPGAIETSNRETLAARAGAPVHVLPTVPEPTRAALAAAGAGLPAADSAAGRRWRAVSARGARAGGSAASSASRTQASRWARRSSTAPSM